MGNMAGTNACLKQKKGHGNLLTNTLKNFGHKIVTFQDFATYHSS